MVSPHLHVWIVVAIYLILVTVAGSYYSKFMATSEAYFKAGNAVPWWASGISMYMSNFTAYTFVGLGSLVYREGMTGLLLETGPALAFLLAAKFFARRWHRLNLISPPEYLEARFNPTTRKVFSVFGISTTFISSGMRLYAMCKFAEGMMGVPLLPAIVVTGAIIVVYTMLGGLWAVIITDFVQFVVLYLAAFCLLLMSAWAIFAQTGWHEFLAQIPAGYATFPGPNPEHAWGWLLVFWFTYLLDYNGDWGIIQRMCCTPTERDARRSALLSMAFSVPHAFLLLGPCFLARVLFSEQVGDPNDTAVAEGAYGKIAALLLPPGLVGVVAAAMFSATMSTLSTAWSVRSASLVNDLYVRFVRPLAQDREQIFVGRVAVAVFGAIAVAVAAYVAARPSGLFALAQDLVGLVVIPLLTPLLGALFVRRTKAWAALASMGACLAFGLANKFAPGLLGLGAPLDFAWEVPLQFTLGLAVLVLSGWVPQTAHERAQQISFDARLATPRPAPTVDTSLPPPLGVMSGFVLLIGALVLVLCIVPQTGVQRLVTLAGGLLLLVAGALMRRAQRHLSARAA